MNLPEDVYLLLSLVNMKLRDNYASLEEFCGEEEVDCAELCARLATAGYYYDEGANAFKAK